MRFADEGMKKYIKPDAYNLFLDLKHNQDPEQNI